MTNYIPVSKRSKKLQREFYNSKRGAPVPPTRREKGSHSYKNMKLELKMKVD